VHQQDDARCQRPGSSVPALWPLSAATATTSARGAGGDHTTPKECPTKAMRRRPWATSQSSPAQDVGEANRRRDRQRQGPHQGLLAEVGLPVPRGEVVRDAEAAVAAAQRIGFPVVTKPLDGNHGRGVTLDLDTPMPCARASPMPRAKAAPSSSSSSCAVTTTASW
jgi:hypothetical protein